MKLAMWYTIGVEGMREVDNEPSGEFFSSPQDKSNKGNNKMGCINRVMSKKSVVKFLNGFQDSNTNVEITIIKWINNDCFPWDNYEPFGLKRFHVSPTKKEEWNSIAYKDIVENAFEKLSNWVEDNGGKYRVVYVKKYTSHTDSIGVYVVANEDEKKGRGVEMSEVSDLIVGVAKGIK